MSFVLGFLFWFAFLFVCWGGLFGLVLFFNYLSLLQQRIQTMHAGTCTLLFHIFTQDCPRLGQPVPQIHYCGGELSGWLWQESLCCRHTLWHRLRTEDVELNKKFSFLPRSSTQPTPFWRPVLLLLCLNVKHAPYEPSQKIICTFNILAEQHSSLWWSPTGKHNWNHKRIIIKSIERNNCQEHLYYDFKV